MAITLQRRTIGQPTIDTSTITIPKRTIAPETPSKFTGQSAVDIANKIIREGTKPFIGQVPFPEEQAKIVELGMKPTREVQKFIGKAYEESPPIFKKALPTVTPPVFPKIQDLERNIMQKALLQEIASAPVNPVWLGSVAASIQIPSKLGYLDKLKTDVGELITGKRMSAFEASQLKAKNIINKFKEPGTLKSYIKGLSEEGRIIPISETDAQGIENKIHDVWSKTLARSKTSQTPINILTPEELLGAREPGYFLKGEGAVTPEKAIEVVKPRVPAKFTGQPLEQQGAEEARYQAALKSKEMLQPRKPELEIPLHPIEATKEEFAKVFKPVLPTPEEKLKEEKLLQRTEEARKQLREEQAPEVLTAVEQPEKFTGQPIGKLTITPTDEEKNLIDEMIGEVETGTPGKKWVNKVEGETVTGYTASTYPEWFKDKGYTAKQALGILNKVKSGTKLTELQSNIYQNMIDDKKEFDVWSSSKPLPKGATEFEPEMFEGKVKEPWQMTQLEFYDSRKGGQFALNPFEAKDIHKQEVERAISEGKQVSSKVLKDYPGFTGGPKAGGQTHEITPQEQAQIHKMDLQSVKLVNLNKPIEATDIFGNPKKYNKGENIYIYKDPKTGKALVKDGDYGILQGGQVDKVEQAGSVAKEGKVMAGGITHPIRQETTVGRGTVLNTKAQTDRSKMVETMKGMPFSLLGNKAEVLSRLSNDLKYELKRDIDKVFDLFGGAKGYRAGLFKDIPSENYALNEFSNERYNYYKNIQNPESLATMKAVVKDLRAGLIDRIAKAFEIPTDKYSPEELRKAINKWLHRGLEPQRKQFATQIIQNYGNELLAQAVADKFQSPESSAIYYFLQNTSVFGISQNAQGQHHWSQGIIRSSQDVAEIKDTMRRIEEVDSQLDMEARRDAKMPITQKDAWQVMDEITQKITKRELDPQKTAVLVDPQYLNPTQKEGTYTVGQKDASWEGHKDNLEKHLKPLIATGARIIYTNNDDINLIRWLKENKLPYNIEESIGATALRGGRDEIISFINYQLSKEYTRRVGSSAVGEQQYLGNEITGESATFDKWLAEQERVAGAGEVKIPSFGKDWTPEQRKNAFIRAMQEGFIYKDSKGNIDRKDFDAIFKKHPDFTYAQLMNYIINYKGPEPPVGRGGIIPPELNFGKWKDRGAFGLARETLERNIEDVAGSEAPIVKQFILTPIRNNETARIEFINSLRKEMQDRMKEWHITLNSKDDKLVMRFGEGRITLDELKKESLNNWPNIQRAAEYFKSKYDWLLDTVNYTRGRFGYEPIPKRHDYFRHFQELGGIINNYGIILSKESLPTQIAGLTGLFKPGKPFSTAELQRKGFKTTESAIGGMDNYIESITRQMFHIDSVQRARTLEKYIRMSGEEGVADLPNFAAFLTEYGNLLAGKKATIDRVLEGLLGRGIFKGFGFIKGQTSANMILGNISSALMNFAPFVQSVSTTNKGAVIKSMASVFSKDFNKIAGQKSDFLTRRYPIGAIQLTGFQNAKQAAGYLFFLVDRFSAKTITAAKYYENIGKKMPPKDAMKDADEYAGKVITDRSWGQLPNIFRTNTLGFITQFQTEINNVVSFIKKDIPRQAGGNALKLASYLLQFVIYSYIFNEIMEKATGRRPILDPLYAGLTIAGISEQGKDKGVGERLWVAGQDIRENIPFGSLGSGRFPIGAGMPDLMKLAKGDTTMAKEWTKPLYYILMPFGGGQVKKTVEGLTAVNRGYEPTPSGKQKRYDIEQTPTNVFRGGIFGKYAFPEAREYYNLPTVEKARAREPVFSGQGFKSKFPSKFKSKFKSKF